MNWEKWGIHDAYNAMCLAVIAFCVIIMSNLLLHAILTRHGM